jgi:hypothetical protein
MRKRLGFHYLNVKKRVRFDRNFVVQNTTIDNLSKDKMLAYDDDKISMIFFEVSLYLTEALI